jgi:hypothetical protein
MKDIKLFGTMRFASYYTAVLSLLQRERESFSLFVPKSYYVPAQAFLTVFMNVSSRIMTVSERSSNKNGLVTSRNGHETARNVHENGQKR